MKYIKDLKIRADDSWKKDWIELHGKSVYTSPEFIYYTEGLESIKDWPALRPYRIQRMDLVLMSIDHWEQIEPIVINKDNDIITGHKRAAAMAYLGYNKIKTKYES